MLLQELYESRSDLYHGTALTSLLSILEDGEIKDSGEDGVSLTRDWNYRVTLPGLVIGETDPDALIAIDGNKLSRIRKVKPFAQQGLYKGEMEERVYGNIPATVFKTIYLDQKYQDDEMIQQQLDTIDFWQDPKNAAELWPDHGVSHDSVEFKNLEILTKIRNLAKQFNIPIKYIKI